MSGQYKRKPFFYCIHLTVALQSSKTLFGKLPLCYVQLFYVPIFQIGVCMSFLKIINASNIILVPSVNLAKQMSSMCQFSDAILIKTPRPLSYPLLFVAQGQTTSHTYQERGSLHYHHFQWEVGQKESLISQKHQKVDEGEGGQMLSEKWHMTKGNSWNRTFGKMVKQMQFFKLKELFKNPPTNVLQLIRTAFHKRSKVTVDTHGDPDNLNLTITVHSFSHSSV